jgi:hypothetical protein
MIRVLPLTAAQISMLAMRAPANAGAPAFEHGALLDVPLRR